MHKVVHHFQSLTGLGYKDKQRFTESVDVVYHFQSLTGLEYRDEQRFTESVDVRKNYLTYVGILLFRSHIKNDGDAMSWGWNQDPFNGFEPSSDN